MASFAVSEKTLAFLRNIAGISKSVLLDEGRVQRATTTSKAVIVTLELPEAWPQESAIYELNSFIGVLSLFKTPVIEFDDNLMTISKGSGAKVLYRLSEPSLVMSVPKFKKDGVTPLTFDTENPAVTFVLSDVARTQLHKMASMLQLDTVHIIVKNGVVKVTGSNYKNPTSHAYEYEVPESDVTINNPDFSTDLVFSESSLSLFFEGSYTVAVSGWPYAVFTNTTEPVSYLVAILPKPAGK